MESNFLCILSFVSASRLRLGIKSGKTKLINIQQKIFKLNIQNKLIINIQQKYSNFFAVSLLWRWMGIQQANITPPKIFHDIPRYFKIFQDILRYSNIFPSYFQDIPRYFQYPISLLPRYLNISPACLFLLLRNFLNLHLWMKIWSDVRCWCWQYSLFCSRCMLSKRTEWMSG